MRISDWSSDVCSSDLIAKDFLGQIDSALGTPPHQATDNADRLAGAIHATRDQYPAPPQPAMLTEDVVMELASYLIPGEAISVKGEDQKKSRSEEHTSELQSLMRISYAVFCLKKKKKTR